MGLKKKEEIFILGNALSTMLLVSGMLNLYAMPGTNTTTLMATSPLTILPSFFLVLLAYVIFAVLKIVYKLKKEDNLPTNLFEQGMSLIMVQQQRSQLFGKIGIIRTIF